MLLVLVDNPQIFLDYVEKHNLDRKTTYHVTTKHQASIWDADSKVIVLEKVGEDEDSQIIPFSDNELISHMKERFGEVTYDQI